MTLATAPVAPRHGIYEDGNLVSRHHAKDLRIQPGWLLVMSPNGFHFYLCIEGGEHHRTHMKATAQRAQREALALFDTEEDFQ